MAKYLTYKVWRVRAHTNKQPKKQTELSDLPRAVSGRREGEKKSPPPHPPTRPGCLKICTLILKGWLSVSGWIGFGLNGFICTINIWYYSCFFFVNNFSLRLYAPIFIYRVIPKTLRDFRPLRYSSRDGHAEGEHVNRGRDIQVSVLPYRCSICPPCSVCLGCCAAEFGSSGGTCELPCTYYAVPLVP